MNKPIKHPTSLNQRGAIALPAILMLASILLAVGLAINLSSNNKIEILKNDENAMNAFYIAESGIKDAKERLSRDKSFNSNYAITINGGTAQVSMSGALPAVTIESKGTYQNNVKTVRATLNVNSDGKILSESAWEEI